MNSTCETVANTEPLCVVLCRAAEEVRRLAENLASLDRAIGRAVISVEAGEMEKLQHADTVRQGLEGLSQFFTALAETADPETMCDPVMAVRDIPMRAQARRLALLPHNLPQATDPDDELWDL